MATASENPLPTPNSPQEYANGVTVDGDNLTIVSKELIKDHLPNEKQLPSCISKRAEPKSPHHIEADKQVLQAQQEHIERVRESVEALRGAVALAELARQILAKQAEGALLDQEIANEHKRRFLERLKTMPVDQLVEGEEQAHDTSVAQGREATSRDGSSLHRQGVAKQRPRRGAAPCMTRKRHHLKTALAQRVNRRVSVNPVRAIPVPGRRFAAPHAVQAIPVPGRRFATLHYSSSRLPR